LITGRPRLAVLTIVALVMYVLHQDLWFWRSARPLVFGVLPIGLFYHVVFTVGCSALLWALVTYAWPAHLEEDSWHAAPKGAPARARRGESGPHERRFRSSNFSEPRRSFAEAGPSRGMGQSPMSR
jgi:hypothetical protein